MAKIGVVLGVGIIVALGFMAVNAAQGDMAAPAKESTMKDMHMAQKKCMEKMPTVNDRCPITGNKIDIMNTPENLTTLYKGKKVGFCCPNCPPAWEKLTDKEKDEKLAKVMFKMPQAKTMP